ncbi:class II aldolase and adducin N-terminal domain-containing protein [Campylobacter sp. JMF_11 EL3]|uniref:class II aldolase and adducin N-terminal domain-containing protein n=1 Tax=Campylobacter sp. JMF_11 EL3 TaxID=2983841 RepID=UPI0022E9D579|nr:class II aldolase and adducin N-terminal domain-containing protein [Campylobacter sp. JMF_11 EL3]MDA3063585.1 class II aldolase and adducin N-terminal domain-containing protein [Campylobacter sp. JMF_11 EL3]
MDEYYYEILRRISLSMFRKELFGIFHGSISAKVKDNQFIINKKNAIFDSLSLDDFVALFAKKDYRWEEASIDSDIHLNIYKNIKEAKFVAYAMPPYLLAYTLEHDFIIPRDYYGATIIKRLEIYDPKNYDDWHDRAPHEIYNYMMSENSDIIVVRGYGVFAYARSAQSLAKKIAVLENSCKMLLLNHN